MNIANAPSSTSGAKPSIVCCEGGAGASGSESSPNQTNAPSASIATSLNTDSNAIASTSPRLCSVALARRVPNSIANSAIANATYSDPSRQTDTPVLAPSPVRVTKLIVTALSCSAM